MKRKFTLLLSMLLLIGTCSVWAETIEAASDGYYHITDKSTWSKFARTVNGTGGYTQNVALNAVLDDDVTIEDDGDFKAGFIVGNGDTPTGGVPAIYTGTFDGQGHTLTFTKTLDVEFLAPFGKVSGATIKNLKVAGTLTGSNASARLAVVAYVEHTEDVTTNIQYVASAMNLTTTNGSFDGTIGGIVGLVNTNANLVVQGCMYTGTVTSVKSTSGILGYSRSNNVTIKNNLAKCTFTLSNTKAGSNRYVYRAADESSITNENNFYQITNTNSVPVSGNGTEANEAQYNSGEMAWYLSGADNSSSSTYFWGQDLNNASSTPMLTSDAAYKVFNAGDKYTNWTNTINNDEDWVTFSKLVANGYADMNVTMTADVTVSDGTMIGTSSKPYEGTFDGKGHTLTFTYSGSDQFAAPFQYVNAATFQDIIITGSITSSSNQIASLVGKNTGATTISRCVSHATINSTDSSNGCVGGFVGSSADNGNPATNTVVFNYCLYDGSITTSKSGYAAGFVAWDDGTNSITLNNCMVAATIGENAGGKNFSQAPNIPDGKFAYYLNKFGSDSNGTKLTEQLLNSGQAAWTLNYGNESDVLFFGQGKLNKSNIEAYPTLTSDATKKVVKLTPQGVSTPLYANPGGAAPNPVRYGALGFRLQGSSDNPSLVVLPNDITDATTLVRRYDQYTLSVSSAGATTLVLPFDAELPSGVTAYNITYTSGKQVTAKPVNKITANEPVLINAAEGTYTFTVSNSSVIPYGTASYTNGALTGVYVQSNKSGDYNPIAYVPANSYVLQNKSGVLGFYKVAAEKPIKITSFRAYLTAQVAQTAPALLSINFEDENTTAISNVERNNKEDDAIYTLTGIKVEQPTSGIYIKNGKKYYVK